MSDAGDEIQVDAPAAEVEVAAEAPKGKMSVEDALQVRYLFAHRVNELCLTFTRTFAPLSKFWRTRLFATVSQGAFVRLPKLSTNARPISAFLSRHALKPNTSSSSRPFAPNTRLTSSKSAMPKSSVPGRDFAKSIGRATPVRLLVVLVLLSKTTALRVRGFTSCWITSRTDRWASTYHSPCRESFPVVAYCGIRVVRVQYRHNPFLRWQNRLPLLRSLWGHSLSGIIILSDFSRLVILVATDANVIHRWIPYCCL